MACRSRSIMPSLLRSTPAGGTPGSATSPPRADTDGTPTSFGDARTCRDDEREPAQGAGPCRARDVACSRAPPALGAEPVRPPDASDRRREVPLLGAPAVGPHGV